MSSSRVTRQSSRLCTTSQSSSVTTPIGISKGVESILIFTDLDEERLKNTTKQFEKGENYCKILLKIFVHFQISINTGWIKSKKYCRKRGKIIGVIIPLNHCLAIPSRFGGIMHCFVTVGTTCFDSLINVVLSEEFIEAIKFKKFDRLTVQCGSSNIPSFLTVCDQSDVKEQEYMGISVIFNFLR